MKTDDGTLLPRLFRGRGLGSAMVEAAFALTGRRIERVTASRWQGARRLAELEAVNPLGQVPTLVWPDGTVQSESAAILIELALRHPEAGLLPSVPSLRAQALRWLVYLSANVYPHYTVRDFPERWSGNAGTQAVLVEAATERIRSAWAVLASQWRPLGAFAFGTAPGAFDLAVAVISRWTPGRGWFMAEFPHLADVVRAVDAHPRLAPVWAENFPDD
jgi:GST-like protein